MFVNSIANVLLLGISTHATLIGTLYLALLLKLSTKQFLDTYDNCLLCQHVDFKTRFKGSQRALILDLVLTSYPNSVSGVAIIAIG